MNKEYVSYIVANINTSTDDIENIANNLKFVENRFQHNCRAFDNIKGRICDLYQLYENMQNNKKDQNNILIDIKKQINKTDDITEKYKSINNKIELVEDDIIILNDFMKKFQISE